MDVDDGDASSEWSSVALKLKVILYNVHFGKSNSQHADFVSVFSYYVGGR